jgi:hypothetical protein
METTKAFWFFYAIFKVEDICLKQTFPAAMIYVWFN